MERRLAAILAADVVGYSKLMGEDEDRTLTALRELRRDVLAPIVEQHRGTVIKSMGDGWLVEFPSARDGVRCAIEVQEGLQAQDIINLRIGVHVGDVTFEEEDIYGDGVNVAARLQEIAEPGGLSISDMAYNSLDNQTTAAFAGGDQHRLKNIARDIAVWQWRTADGPPRPEPKGSEPLALPDKPSIAVLPFANMSGDPDQEFFADGMTEDIITGLSRFRSLFVIARNSTFAYKGTTPDIRDVAVELGVRYVLEGSIRKAGNRIRVTGQLIDATTGSHIWAERYDHELDDIFLVQDKVTSEIVAAIAPEIDQVERDRAKRQPPESLDAWVLLQRALVDFYSTTKDGITKSIHQFDQIIESYPDFALGYAYAAEARVRFFMHFDIDDQSLLVDALQYAREAARLDSRDADCLASEARALSMSGFHNAAIEKAQQAVNLNPNSAMAYYCLGFILGRDGQFEDGVSKIEEAIRLSPRDIYIAGFYAFGAALHFNAGNYQVAVEWGQRAVDSPNPRAQSSRSTAAALVKLGRLDEARNIIERGMQIHPEHTLSLVRKLNMFMFAKNPDRVEEFANALQDAGLTD